MSPSPDCSELCVCTQACGMVFVASSCFMMQSITNSIFPIFQAWTDATLTASTMHPDAWPQIYQGCSTARCPDHLIAVEAGLADQICQPAELRPRVRQNRHLGSLGGCRGLR